ncbi:MAG: manganese efflux pump [Spirochaetes bacterium]|nr:manganese efflux pump [Spirochaetota bacterium]
MDFLSVLIVAVALAMDAFSVCVSCGMVIVNPGFRHYFRLAFHFGLFQFMMPIFGYFGGRYLEGYIKTFDHWIAFGLLLFIGLKMIYEAFSHEKESCDQAKDPSRGWSLIVLAVATSIDALAVGLSLGVLGRPILLPSVIIGAVCALFSVIGISIGRRVGPLVGRRAEAVGGLMLVAIGIKILVEHLAG